MNKSVWIFQINREIRAKGKENASWHVGWYDLAGKRHSESCGPGSHGKNQAEKRLRRIQSELDMGVHQPQIKKTWVDFRAEYEEQILSRLEASSQVAIKVALAAFQRHSKPGRVESITTQMIDGFVAKRSNDKGNKAKSKVSPATINKDLRHLKAAFKKAHEWGYLPKVPRIRMVREPEKLPRFVTPEHFALIYSTACAKAKFPNKPVQRYSATMWWQALVVTAYMTGLRIKELMSIRREDLDLKNGFLITRAKDNKGKRDESLRLHPLVIDHLSRLDQDARFPLAWPHDPRLLWKEFGRIQAESGIHLPCAEEHDHTPSCHVYGFHDFRRAYATVMAPLVKPHVLQKLMRHKSFKTTLSYVNLAEQVDEAVLDMPVPEELSGFLK